MDSKKGLVYDDDAIVDLFLARDEEAIGAVMEKYGKLLFTVCNGILRSPPDAEECVNDTYSTLWKTIPPNKPYGRLKGYICKTAIFHSNNAVRKNARRSGVTYGTDELNDIADREADIGREEDRETIVKINDFLGKRSKEERLIFVKKFSFEFTDAQIADEQGISLSTVKNTIRKLRKELKKYLKGDGDER